MHFSTNVTVDAETAIYASVLPDDGQWTTIRLGGEMSPLTFSAGSPSAALAFFRNGVRALEALVEQPAALVHPDAEAVGA